MSVSSMNRVMQRIRQAVVDADDPCEADADLLARFLSHDDSRAVGVLIRRHAPMVWGVCRRILLDHHNAEDAFQATFLVLLRKANTIKPRSMVGNWLHGVAFQTALKARAITMKRSTREKPMATVPEPAPKAKGDHPMLEFLDEELNRLPDKYRVVLVLCDLQSKTRTEAARELGWAEGTVASRLARGRQMLAKRLGRHGTVVSAGTIGALLANNAASAAPASVVASTVQAALTIVSVKTMAAAGLSQHVITLADGVVKTMLLSKLKFVGVILTIAVLACFGIGSAIQMYAGEQGPAATPPAAGATYEKKGEAPQKREQKQEKEGFTAWGKEIGGLQAGLGFRPGQKRAYSQGETVRVVARIRNVGKEAVDFKHIWAFFVENPPKITDADGKLVQLPNYRTRDQGLHMPRSSNVAPGKEVELYEWTFDLQPNGENSSRSFIHGTGKFSLQCERIVGPTWLNPDHPNPTLSKLATGKLELEVKAKEREKTPPKQKQKQEKEGFTAWGKEVGGLQAGLSLRPGEKRVYHHGDVIALVVRVRNVGKQTVKFEYVRQFLDENLPTVTNADGKTAEQHRLAMLGFHVPMEVTLEPGKETELESRLPLRYEFRPANGGGKPTTKERPLFVGTGKVSIQYEQVLGNSSSGTIKLDPALSKLATGKLELEVKEPEKQPPEKESFTAWGKEAGGLQAGLGFRPGEHRAYHHGETVKLVVRVRNIGKETVNFEYLKQFFMEIPPTVTNGDGKPVPQLRYQVSGEVHLPVEVSLAPGKEIELCTWTPELKPGNKVVPDTLWASGKVSIQYERIFGNTGAGQIKLDAILSKLGTGKLELEIKSEPPAGTEKKAPQKQEPGDQTAKKFWAGMSVNQPLFRAGQNANLLQFNFALVNESDKVIDPKIPGYPRLIVNGEELDLTRIPGVGPRDGRFKALPPGDKLQFGMGAGQFFDKPGVYRVYWQGEEFRSNEIVFRVMK